MALAHVTRGERATPTTHCISCVWCWWAEGAWAQRLRRLAWVQLHVLYVKPYGRGRFGDAGIACWCVSLCVLVVRGYVDTRPVWALGLRAFLLL